MNRKVLLLCLSLMLTLTLMPVAAFAQEVSFTLTADNERAAVGQEVKISVAGDHLIDMYGFEINLKYDTSKLRYRKAESLLTGFSLPLTPNNGKLVFAHTKIGRVDGITGKSDLANIIFEITGPANAPTTIELTEVTLLKSDLNRNNLKTRVKIEINPQQRETSVTFKDIKGHWAQQQIERAARLGYVNGYGDGTFRPNREVTRAEFTAMISRAMELKADGSTELVFADKDQFHDWAKPVIAEAQLAGITNGYEDGTFRPSNLINRTEMTVMAARALGIEINETAKPTFADVQSIPAWAQSAIAAAEKTGLVNGRGNHQFVPLANTTRAEAIVMILRLVDYSD